MGLHAIVLVHRSFYQSRLLTSFLVWPCRYHSHFSESGVYWTSCYITDIVTAAVQFGAGFGGSIIINGPASMNYDIDLGTMTIEDWFHSPSVFAALVGIEDACCSPLASTALINGTNTFPCNPSNSTCTGTGKCWETTMAKEKTSRLRLINNSVQNYYRFTIDNHRFRVIANDLVPVRPYDTDSLVIGEGQSFDIIFDADQPVGKYKTLRWRCQITHSVS